MKKRNNGIFYNIETYNLDKKERLNVLIRKIKRFSKQLIISFIVGFLGVLLAYIFFYSVITIKEPSYQYNDLLGPNDWINDDKIHIYNNKICIDGDFELSNFADSNSMIPVLDNGHTGIEIPLSQEDVNKLKVGDIISYFDIDGNLIIHRIIEVGYDSKGWFAITKGDNNKINDGKIRKEQVRCVLVGIIY